MNGLALAPRSWHCTCGVRLLKRRPNIPRTTILYFFASPVKLTLCQSERVLSAALGRVFSEIEAGGGLIELLPVTREKERGVLEEKTVVGYR